MGILDTLRAASRLSATLAADVPPVAVASPMHPRPNHLQPLVWADLLGHDYKPLDRADAMTIPAVVRGRGLICTTIARATLEAIDTDGNELDEQPIWLRRTDGPVSPFHRMLWTADDLLFYGMSLWALRRDVDGNVIAADRVPMGEWDIDQDHRITVLGQVARAEEVALIPGIHEGILSFGRETLSQGRGLLRAAERAATHPSAMIELHQTDDAPMTDEEIDAVVERWVAARKGTNGGVAFTSSAVETKELSAAKEHLLIEGRAASSIDLARLLGIPAPMIDASQPGTSMSYSNTASRMNELIAFGIAPYMAAIAARLSLNDMLPRGTQLRFDTHHIVAAVEQAVAHTPPERPRRDPAVSNDIDDAHDRGQRLA